MAEECTCLCSRNLGPPFAAKISEYVLANAFNFPSLLSNAVLKNAHVSSADMQRIQANFLRLSQLALWWNFLTSPETASTQSLIDVPLASSAAAQSLLTDAHRRFHPSAARATLALARGGERQRLDQLYRTL